MSDACTVLTGRQRPSLDKTRAAERRAQHGRPRPRNAVAAGTARVGPYAGEPEQIDKAQAELGELVARAGGPSTFPMRSTQRELRRYEDSWTSANGFFGDSPDLAVAVCRVLDAAGLA